MSNGTQPFEVKETEQQYPDLQQSSSQWTVLFFSPRFFPDDKVFWENMRHKSSIHLPIQFIGTGLEIKLQQIIDPQYLEAPKYSGSF